MTRIDRINPVPPRPAVILRPVAARTLALGITGRLNIGLAIAALVLLMYYVMQVNMLAASAWQLKDARAQLATLHGEHTAFVAQIAELEDRPVLEALARRSGLVPADPVVYLIQPSAVAAAR